MSDSNLAPGTSQRDLDGPECPQGRLPVRGNSD
jgi:hypothetical protein